MSPLLEAELLLRPCSRVRMWSGIERQSLTLRPSCVVKVKHRSSHHGDRYDKRRRSHDYMDTRTQDALPGSLFRSTNLPFRHLARRARSPRPAAVFYNPRILLDPLTQFTRRQHADHIQDGLTLSHASDAESPENVGEASVAENTTPEEHAASQTSESPSENLSSSDDLTPTKQAIKTDLGG